jgi:hypothetical protein
MKKTTVAALVLPICFLAAPATAAKVCQSNTFAGFPVPDYTAMETINRIASSGGSWTVDRNGFAAVSTHGATTSLYSVYINDKLIAKVDNNANNKYVTSTNDVYPVSVGDVVKVYGQNISCYFIPIKWVSAD